MANNKTSRSSNDGKVWKCGCGTLNVPTKHRFFNLPTFQCSSCGKKLSLDFKFCLGEIEVEGKSLTGKVLDQRDTPLCVAYAYSKAAEVTERVFHIRKGTDPDCVVRVDPLALEERFLQKFPDLPDHESRIKDKGLHKVLHLGLILRSEGCIRGQPLKQHELYKAPDVSTIPADSFEQICQTLAEGTPLVGTYLAGKRRNKLPYCKIYKSPSLAAIKAKHSQRIGHAVVIIGAGMKKGKRYFYFLNSWGKKFCPRKNREGETLTGGIGKLRPKDLTKNLVKLSPPDEIVSAGQRSLQHQEEYDINAVNAILMLVPEKQYSAPRLQRLREKTNHEFVPPDNFDDGIFRDDEGGVRPHTCCAKKSHILKVIKKLTEHFPIKRAPLRVHLTARKPNLTAIMEKVCEIEASILHSCEELLKDVQGRVEVRSVSAHAVVRSVEKHDSVEVPQPQAAPAKGPDAVAQISETMQKQSISSESLDSAQDKQQRRCSSREGAKSVMCSWKTSYTQSTARVGGTSKNTRATRTGSPLSAKRSAWWRWEDLRDYDF